MSAKKFLDLVEQSGMLEKSLIADLRKQASKKKTTAAAIARRLVEKGLLTKFQATKLVAESTAGIDDAEPSSSAPAADAELGFAPLGDEDDAEEDEAAEDDVVMLEDAGDALTPVEDAGAALTPVGTPANLTPAEPEPTVLEEISSGLDSAADPFGGSVQHAVKAPKRRGPKKNVWESKLMFGGILALALMVLIGVPIYLNLTATPANAMWEQAMEDYRSESYSQAQARFEEFLEDYPEHDYASEGRVRVVLCKIRVVISDPQKGLERANELIPTIESEDAFPVARDELARVLIQVPQGFVRKAKASNAMAQKEELVVLAEKGMEMINNPAWIPTTKRKAIQIDIDDVTEDIVLVHRDINQDRELAAAIAEINTAARSGRTDEAYQIYKALLKKYPGVANDVDLINAIKTVTQQEKSLVTVSQELLEASTEVTTSKGMRVVLASRSGDGASQLAGQVVSVLANGSVYGLDAGSGKILWSRFIGYGASAGAVRISPQSDTDFVVVDSQDQTLVRLNAKSGETVWQLPLGEQAAEPVMVGTTMFVTTASGRILEVDPRSGASPRQAKISQDLTLPPAIAPNRPRMFQMGRHSNLYVMSTETLECKDVYYIGHKEGTISIPPIVHLGHVFIVENAGSDYCLLHILAIKPEGETPSLEEAQEPIRLKGGVIVPLELYGRRLLLVTDRGGVEVYDVDVNKRPSTTSAATLPASMSKPLLSFPLTDANSLWIAGDRLTKYRIQVTRKEINREDIANVGDTFIARPQLFGDVLVHVRRPKDSAGVVVTAVHIDTPRRALWETHLGVPAGRVAVDKAGKSIHVISAAASLFSITGAELKQGLNDEPKMTARSRSGALMFTDQIELGDGRVAFFNSAATNELLLYEPTARTPLRVVTLELPEGDVTANPAAFEGGLLIPTSSGDVALLDAGTGKNKAKPFRPQLEPGEKIRWLRPAILGDQFVIADNRRNVYRVAIKETPQPFLTESARESLAIDLDSPLAAAGDTVYGVVRAPGGDLLIALNASDLKMAQEFDLAGQRVTWGPETVGDVVLLVTDNKQVHCYDATQKARWKDPANAYGKPAGRPLVEGGDFIFASCNGAIWRLAGDSGEEMNKAEIGEPLANGPVAFNGQLLLGGNDGAVHVIPIPTGS